MLNRDYIRLKHMLDASQAAVSYLLEKRREDLDHSRLLLNGVVRELEILGEAASQVSPIARERFSFLPWREMVGLRNRLIHAYFDVNNQTIWLVVKESLPPLILQLETDSRKLASLAYSRKYRSSLKYEHLFNTFLPDSPSYESLRLLTPPLCHT